MPTLTPVEGDPFAAASPAPSGGPKLTPVEGDPFAAPAEPHTTAGGLAASFARGAAPIATGAAIGAGVGSVVPGIGTAIGAGAGAVAAGLTDLAGVAYKPIAQHFGYDAQTPKGITDKTLDVFGVQRPSTTAEYLAEFGGGLFPFGVGAAKTAVAAGIPEMIHEGRAAAAEKWIDQMYSRAVGPRTAGRDTMLQRRSAISDIVENKGSLKYTDPEGAVIASGRSPESLSEWGQAIDQTKLSLFNRWNTMAKLAGQSGATVDLRPIAQELRQFASDPSLIRNNPAAVNHALEMAARYEKTPLINPTEAQHDLTILNENLRRYFRSPSAIEPADNMASRLMRDQMDKTIGSYAGPGWQELRNRYGALRAIEDDVDRGARRVANWRAGGGVFNPMVNALAIGEVAMGRDLKSVAAAAVTKAGGEAIKRYFHPDAVVKRIFRTAEKYHKPSGGTSPGGGPSQPPIIPPGQQPPVPPPGAMPASRAGTGGLHSGGSAGPLPPQPPAISTGPQPPRPTGGAMPPQQPGTPAPPGGYSAPSSTQTYGVQPVRPSSALGDDERFYMPPGGGAAF